MNQHGIAFGFLFCLSLAGQGFKVGNLTWTGETEFTQTQKGQRTYDFPIFAKIEKTNLLIRGFFAEQGPHRGEFAVGKTLVLSADVNNKPRAFITQYIGSTTNGAIFTPLIFGFNLFGYSGYYLADPKFFYSHKSDNHGNPDPLNQNTLYQKASLGLTRTGGWQARWERLWVFDTQTIYNRFVVERRFWVHNSAAGQNSHFHISPFYDSQNKSAGFYTGFRWQ